ncbi:MAG: cyclic nucleotide-binding protein, partial [Alphaproteobacteria bacterium]
MSPVLRRLQIQPGEAGPFGWSALVLLLVNLASFLLNNYGETTFLKRFGVEYLPLITAVNAVVTFFLPSLFAGRIGRIRGDRQLVLVLSGYAILALLLRLLVPLDIKLLYPLIYVLKSQFTILIAFIFWNVANDLFSTRQSKRLFPVITAGGLLGAIAGNLATPALDMVLPTDELLPVFSLVVGLAAGGTLRLGRYLPASRVKATAGTKQGSLVSELRRIRPLFRQSALIRILLLLALLPNLVIPIINYQFSFVADMSFASESSLIRFFGYFRGIQNGIALLLSLMMGRLYGRFGLAVSLMFHPANYLLVFAGFLVRFDLVTAVYGNLSAGILRRAVNTPAGNALYSLLPEKDRVLVRSFLRGTVVRVGILAGSALLWFSNMVMHPRYLACYGLLFAG